MRFKPGDKVRCIEVPGGEHHILKKNRIYTIQNCMIGPDGVEYCKLVDVFSVGRGWFASRFVLLESELSPFASWEKKNIDIQKEL